MRMPASLKLALPLLVWLAFFSTDASAQMNSSGLFDDVLNRYNAAASGWAGTIWVWGAVRIATAPASTSRRSIRTRSTSAHWASTCCRANWRVSNLFGCRP